MHYRPIFLIGAARSGTKILRDTIATHPELSKIDYDINFIWKRFNEEIKHDELGREDVKPKFIKFIKKYLDKKANGKPFLIEKTVGNTLRIPFLLEIFPNAKFIILYRDGRDVIESVVRQWGGAATNQYLVKKLFSVPVFQVLPFLFSYGVDTLKIKMGLSQGQKYVWGVRYKGIEEDLKKNKSRVEICTKQWINCTSAILQNKDKVPADNLLEIYYEELVKDPNKAFEKIGEFIHLDNDKFNYTSIRPSNVGKAKKTLSKKDFHRIQIMIRPQLIALGYTVDNIE